MAKGIIVLDKIPQTCQHIRGNKEGGCPFGGMVCQICDKDVMEHVKNGTKPDWCPIKQMPERKWIEHIVNKCREGNIPVFMKSSLSDIWGEPLIQEFPEELKRK